jgi:hypothetical protein
MQSKTTQKRKPAIRAKKDSEHYCQKEEIINRLSLFTVGNGDPKKGFLFKIEKSTDDIEIIKKELLGINENHNILLKEITIVGSGLNELRTKIKTTEEIQRDDEARAALATQLKMAKRRDNWYKGLTIVGLAVAIFFGIRNGREGKMQAEATVERIDNLGIPVYTTTRGIVINPDSLRVTFWPKDFGGGIGDTINGINDTIK